MNITSSGLDKLWKTHSRRLEQNRDAFWAYVATIVDIIETGSFVEGGFNTQEAFIKHETGWSRSYFTRLKTACETRQRLLPMGNVVDINERQLREIAKAPQEKQKQIFAKVMEKCELEGRPHTNKDFSDAVKEYKEPSAKKGKPATSDEPIIVDAIEPAEQEPPPLLIVTKAIKLLPFAAIETVLGLIIQLHPKLARSVKSTKTDDGYTTDFNEFWRVYPKGRKKGKKKAFASWGRALKDKVDPLVIIAAAEEYAASEVGQGDYVQGPEPWLNGHCWDDDREAWKEKRNGPVTFNQQKINNTMSAAEKFLNRDAANVE